MGAIDPPEAVITPYRQAALPADPDLAGIGVWRTSVMGAHSIADQHFSADVFLAERLAADPALFFLIPSCIGLKAGREKRFL